MLCTCREVFLFLDGGLLSSVDHNGHNRAHKKLILVARTNLVCPATHSARAMEHATFRAAPITEEIDQGAHLGTSAPIIDMTTANCRSSNAEPNSGIFGRDHTADPYSSRDETDAVHSRWTTKFYCQGRTAQNVQYDKGQRETLTGWETRQVLSPIS